MTGKGECIGRSPEARDGGLAAWDPTEKSLKSRQSRGRGATREGETVCIPNKNQVSVSKREASNRASAAEKSCMMRDLHSGGLQDGSPGEQTQGKKRVTISPPHPL